MSAPGETDPNTESFLQRHDHWHRVLNPDALLASQAEIQKSKSLLEAPGPRNAEKPHNAQVMEAKMLCQASVHPDSGHLLPLIFRPPAYVLLGAPLVVSALIPHATVMSTFLFQIPFQTYNAGFTLVNGNRSVQEETPKHPLYLAAAALYLSCMGAAPALAMKRLGLRSVTSSFFTTFLPPPLYALLGGLSVTLMRLPEGERAIQVLDREGNVVGASQRAAWKAMKETALSRSALLGVTALIPSLQWRSPHRMKNPWLFALLTHLATLVTFGFMVPVSFSLFPQRGSIAREELEEELKEKTAEPVLFYNRGL